MHIILPYFEKYRNFLIEIRNSVTVVKCHRVAAYSKRRYKTAGIHM